MRGKQVWSETCQHLSALFLPSPLTECVRRTRSPIDHSIVMHRERSGLIVRGV